MNIYVGNLSRDVTEEDLQHEFSQFGQIQSVAIIRDKFTRESRGFGFVEMPSKEEGQAAISALNGKDLKGRNLTVNEAKPKTESAGGRGGFGGRGGGGGGRGGFGGRGGGGGRDRGSWGGGRNW